MSGSRNQQEENDIKPNVNSTHINIKITDQNNHDVYFRLKKSTQLEKVLMGYCTKMNTEYEAVVFMFDGDLIQPHLTAEELKMEDGDVIDAFLHQTGGWRSVVAY